MAGLPKYFLAWPSSVRRSGRVSWCHRVCRKCRKGGMRRLTFSWRFAQWINGRTGWKDARNIICEHWLSISSSVCTKFNRERRGEDQRNWHGLERTRLVLILVSSYRSLPATMRPGRGGRRRWVQLNDHDAWPARAQRRRCFLLQCCSAWQWHHGRVTAGSELGAERRGKMLVLVHKWLRRRTTIESIYKSLPKFIWQILCFANF
jgi:hypothetical protein